MFCEYPTALLNCLTWLGIYKISYLKLTVKIMIATTLCFRCNFSVCRSLSQQGVSAKKWSQEVLKNFLEFHFWTCFVFCQVWSSLIPVNHVWGGVSNSSYMPPYHLLRTSKAPTILTLLTALSLSLSLSRVFLSQLHNNISHTISFISLSFVLFEVL